MPRMTDEILGDEVRQPPRTWEPSLPQGNNPIAYSPVSRAVSPLDDAHGTTHPQQYTSIPGHESPDKSTRDHHSSQLEATPSPKTPPHHVDQDGSRSSTPSKTITSRHVSEKLISWWWWWEITAMILSIACMCAIVVLLTKIDNIPLQSWWLPIQPNSLIAALTTVGKATLMVPAASCISQLKWRHFVLRPRNLSDLELFDEASRGPWGSAFLIGRLALRPHVLVALGFAFLTVVALGIDTTTQQVLDFPLGETQLDNTTIELGAAKDYFSKGFLEIPGHSFIWQPTVDLPAVQAAVVNGANGLPPSPYFRCPEPAAECKWDTFSTLGVCTDFKHISGMVTPSCNTSTTRTGMDCTYTSPDPPDGDGLPVTMMMHWDPENNGQGKAMLFQSAFNQTENFTDTMPASLGTFMSIKAYGTGSTEFTDDGEEVPPAADIGFATFTWCVQTFQNVTATTGELVAGHMTSERMGSRVHMASPEPYDEENKMGASYYTYVLNSTGEMYNISRMAASSWSNYLQYMFDCTIYHEANRPNPAYGYMLQLGYTYFKGDTAAVIHNIGEAISNQIRSNSPGDNYNATIVKGTASFMETYIRVRWPWMILPLAETALAAVLLMITILISHNQPLLKTSVIAYLTSKLDGWTEEELQSADTGRLTQWGLEEVANKLVAQLEVSLGVGLMFKRKDSSLKED